VNRIAQAGLVAALAVGSVVGTAQAAQTSHGSATPTAAERALLSHIPTPLRGTCIRTPASARARAAVASVLCRPNNRTLAYYESFRTQAATLAYYDAFRTTGRVARNQRGDCNVGRPHEGTWNRGTGRVVCFKRGGKAYQIWTHNRLRIAATAIRSDGNARALNTFWASAQSGPT
jgi:hypothetical protein